MNNFRNVLKKAFLDNYFANSKYEIQPLAFDASFRRYDRIIFGQNSLILMDSPPEHYTLADFTNIANFLKKHSFSVPEIFKEDHSLGFLLLEDFGSVSINNHLKTISSDSEKLKIYQLIIDLLFEIQQILPPEYLPGYGEDALLKELDVYIEWYLPHKNSEMSNQDAKYELNLIWRGILNKLPDLGKCLLHRDFHIDNLLLLPRQGMQAVGLLDFQDAKIGSPLYDLASLLQDARIDVEYDFAFQCIDYYLQKNSHLDKDEALLAFNILAAQRNSRILGIFMRKYKRDNQDNYLNYIPRVENYLKSNLQHEIFKELRSWLENKNFL